MAQQARHGQTSQVGASQSVLRAGGTRFQCHSIMLFPEYDAQGIAPLLDYVPTGAGLLKAKGRLVKSDIGNAHPLSCWSVGRRK
jgi:hypothetical protein